MRFLTLLVRFVSEMRSAATAGFRGEPFEPRVWDGNPEPIDEVEAELHEDEPEEDESGTVEYRYEDVSNLLIVGGDEDEAEDLASAIVKAIDCKFHSLEASGDVVMGDLSALLINVGENEIVFISNIDRLPWRCIDQLEGALRAGVLLVEIGQGEHMRVHELQLRPFKLVASCRNSGDCPPSLRRLFAGAYNAETHSHEPFEDWTSGSGGSRLSEDALERISDLGVFGLPEGATQDEIRKAYRIEVFLTHPDRLQGMSDEFKAHATERLKRVNIAYQRLKE
jgi:hypothetical protein